MTLAPLCIRFPSYAQTTVPEAPPPPSFRLNTVPNASSGGHQLLHAGLPTLGNLKRLANSQMSTSLFGSKKGDHPNSSWFRKQHTLPRSLDEPLCQGARDTAKELITTSQAPHRIQLSPFLIFKKKIKCHLNTSAPGN